MICRLADVRSTQWQRQTIRRQRRANTDKLLAPVAVLCPCGRHRAVCHSALSRRNGSERLAPRRRGQHRNPGPCPWRRPDGSEGATGPTHAGAGTPNAGTTTVPPAPPVRSGLRSRPAYLNRWPTASHQAEPSGHPGLRRPCHRDGNRRSNPCWDRGAARRAGPHHSGRRSWRS